MHKLNVFLFLTLGIYILLSKFLFDKVYLASNLIIDEEFHLPLGEQYCNFNFDKWDPKVTTLPGLYLISSLLLGPLKLCSIYWLRAVSLIFSCINLLLFYVIFDRHVKGSWLKIFSALTASLLPPLYSLAHLYYTDVVSLTACLLVIILSEKNKHYLASIAGFFAILCRQTNIVFIGIYGGKYVLTELNLAWTATKGYHRKEGALPAQNLKPFLRDLVNEPWKIMGSMKLNFWLNLSCYASVVIFFIVFLLLNGSIVVGDKSAHQVSVNIPQIFYFATFCLAFGWSHFVGEVGNFMNFAKKHKILMLILTLISLLIVHFNTVVHPYLLADNRHIIFYVWNRFYGKIWWFRYGMIPLYLFSLYVILKSVWDKHDISFFVFFIPAVFLLLTTQSLLELRYFLLPYIIFRSRLQIKDSAAFNVVLEFVTYCVMNMIAFNIIFTKTVFWNDVEGPQRIIW